MTSRIETARLILRRPEPRDLSAWEGYFSTERSARNGGPLAPGRAWRAFASQLGAWEINGFGMFVLTLRDGDGGVIGMVGPWCPGDWPEREIGWMLFDPAYEGKGLAFEAAEACLAHAFGPLGWDTAVSYIDPENARSRALAERLGARIDPTADAPAFDHPALVYRHPRPEGLTHE